MPIFVPQNKFMNREKLYNDLSGFLAMHFPCKVQKISINAGFTCPNRDGSVGYGGCTYCNNQTFNPAYCHTEKSVTQQLEEGKRFFVRKYPEMKYLFGKVTMYPGYTRACRDMILYFLNKYFPDTESLVCPLDELAIDIDNDGLEQIFDSGDFDSDFRTLNARIRETGNTIPPLFHAYMSLSPTMRMFGTAVNKEFGDVEETGIFLKIDEIRQEKKQRHIDTFQP